MANEYKTVGLGLQGGEAFQAFKKLYLEVVDQFIDRLNSDQLDESRR